MNFRRILLASGSHLFDNSHLWKRACTTLASPSVGSVVPSAYARRSKRKTIFEKLGNGAVEETLNYAFGKETAFFTEADLFRWAKRLDKEGKHQHALEMLEWMERKKITFSRIQLATYVELIGKTKGYDAAEHYFYKVDPTFNHLAGLRAKNWRCYQKLLDILYKGRIFPSMKFSTRLLSIVRKKSS